jgi:methyl-accepting chemotaxis protein
VNKGRKSGDPGAAAKALQAMEDIARSSAEIDGAMAVLDDIVTHIALLAANAEAQTVRVGDIGPELAEAVAEVRGLAKRSARAAEEIKGLARVSPSRMSREEFVARSAPAIQRLAADAAALSELIEKIGLADPA